MGLILTLYPMTLTFMVFLGVNEPVKYIVVILVSIPIQQTFMNFNLKLYYVDINNGSRYAKQLLDFSALRIPVDCSTPLTKLFFSYIKNTKVQSKYLPTKMSKQFLKAQQQVNKFVYKLKLKSSLYLKLQD